MMYKKVILFLLFIIFNLNITFAEGWTIIPEGCGFASGMMSWDSVFCFFKYLQNSLSNFGLVVAAMMIIYAGYKYATGVFTGDANKGGRDALKYAIYGALIVIFSYAIMKILISTFL